ncbi:glycosyltransferase family 2 protein [Oceanobacillus picturae]|uniref:glycosyltransferase family 2 protein n=1 Tax=Oceanobacillus picturae TaxID=171693 RepID=UPI00362527C9
MSTGLVSCIIPTYKRSDTLVRAINSVLNQSYKNLEVIVVDDNEPDDDYSKITQEKISTINDERLRYIQQEQHINGAAARNVGIRAAVGKYIAFLDDDDEWLTNKLEKQVRVLENNSQSGAVSCLYSLYKNEALVRKCAPYSAENLHKKVLDRSVAVFTSTVLFRKTSLDNAGHFDENLLRHQDLQLLLDFLKVNTMSLIPEYLVALHIDDAGNRPNLNKFIKVKQQFFNSVANHLNMYSKRESKNIHAAHYFEIILIALREKKIGVILRYLFKIGFNFQAYTNLIKRYKERQN